MKRTRKSLSILVVLYLLSLANSISAQIITGGAYDLAGSSDDAIPSIIEVAEMRGEYARHFQRSDGSYVAATYTEPVSYLKDGGWVEIDNSLAAEADDDLNNELVELGSLVPVIDGIYRLDANIEELTSDWDYCYIFLNMENLSKLSFDQRKAIVVHELGHALKLSHNREEEEADNSAWQPEYKATFPANMHKKTDNINNTSGDDYTDAEQHIMSWIITNFDKSALRSKWGN